MKSQKTAQLHLFVCLVIFFACLSPLAYSQITINNIQNFNFGTFYQGSTGGSIDITTSGSRSANGDIILMNNMSSGAQAIFEIEAPKGAVISLLGTPDATLTGSNGGIVTLQLGTADLNNPFIVTTVSPALTRIQISGKLLVGNSKTSPPGLYQGTFAITLNQE